MSYEDIMKDFRDLVERTIKKDQVKRIMLLHEQDFPIDSIASVYELSSDDVKKIIEENKNDFEWGLKSE